MNSKLTRIVAAATTGAVLAIGGAGIAQAAPAAPAATATQAQAQQLSQLATQLGTAAAAGDLGGVQAATDQLRTVLPQLKARGAETAKADQQAAGLQRALTDVPNPVAIVTGLVPGLLASLAAILAGLFGVLPVPLPVPDLPLP